MRIMTLLFEWVMSFIIKEWVKAFFIIKEEEDLDFQAERAV